MINNNKNIFYQKKIGIWGFGIVGQSALEYLDQHKTASIQILDKKQIIIPYSTQTSLDCIIQTEESILQFLEHNDYILVSPGIPLHAYQNYHHKFISELDLIATYYKNPIIAITGTIGKTSITHLLTHIIQATHHTTQAAGNIGTPMLKLLTENPERAVLELSSFQLQQTKKFAPNLAIITNFYPNHLDHHQSLEEYLHAKCNIIRFQNNKQKALLPLELAEQITNIIKQQATWNFFSSTKPTEQTLKKYSDQTIFYLHDKKIYTTASTTPLYDLNTLPPLTFDTNWLIIVAACHLYNINLKTIQSAVKQLKLPDHRLQKIGSWNGCNFYNDSKSTVWQATLQAVMAMNNKPIKLFLGGLSKGADRTPLLQSLEGKNIEIYAFGKEAEHIATLCTQFHIKHASFATLDAAWEKCIKNLNLPCEVLFSPGGSSFDLFIDYQARGQYFTQLVQKFLHP